MKIISDTRVPVKIWTDDIEPEAEAQLKKLASLPFIKNHVAAMPDVHAGKGSTIGSVIATKGAIIPAAVGVDIGCGILAAKLGVKIDAFDNLKDLRHSIERDVPVGFNSNKIITSRVSEAFNSLGQLSITAQTLIKRDKFLSEAKQIGTLGGGNHFIELCFDENNDAWVMLHSGSRNVGKLLADIHINKAKDIMKKYFISLPDPDLAYLAQNTDEFNSYLHDLLWSQQFARVNRGEMMARILKNISYYLYSEDEKIIPDLVIDCHHNYTAIENHYGKNLYITRKGAVSAQKDEYGVIPGSMGTRSYIVKGKGNTESFCSCSHGAGRRMSRTKARSIFNEVDLVAQTAGVECRKDNAVIDEIPGAYKDIDVVMKNQEDLVDVVHTLKQVMCIKG